MNNTYPVHNDSGKHLILKTPASPPTGWLEGLLYAANGNGVAKGVQVRTGSGVFLGSGGPIVNFTITHGMGGVPDFVSVTPQLATPGFTAWGGLLYPYALPDGGYAYWQAQGGPNYGANPVVPYNFGAGFGYFYTWLAVRVLP